MERQVRFRRRRRQPVSEQQLGVDELLGLLSDPDPEARAGAAWQLWEQSDGLHPAERVRCIAALEPVANTEPDASVRADAIRALLALGAPGAVDLALAALHHPDSDVRWNIVEDLDLVHDPRVVEALVPLLEDPDYFVRESAAATLGNLGDPAALEPLRATVRRERWLLRGRALVRHAAEAAIKQIQARRSSPSP
jgi:HEAT repeat protein